MLIPGNTQDGHAHAAQSPRMEREVSEEAEEETPQCTADVAPHLTDFFGMVRSLLPWSTGAVDHEEEPEEHQPPAFIGHAAFLVSVRGLSYLALRADAGLLERCQAAVIQAVASEKEGLGLQAHHIEAMGSHHACQFAVSCADWVTQQELQMSLTRRPQLGKAIASRLASVQGVEAARIGAEGSCEVSAAATEGVVRFQGIWTKDCSSYVIRGSGIRFPSGGRAEMISQDTHKFNITHPSGVSFHAVLESHGQELRWTNGSTWHRSTGQDHNDATTATKASLAPLPLSADSHSSTADGQSSIDGKPERPSAEQQRLAADVGPGRWGLTGLQCKALLEELRLDPMWQRGGNVQALANILANRTEGTFMGYALYVNQERPLEATSLVLHSPDALAEDLLGTIARSAEDHEVFFISVLSRYQTQDSTKDDALYQETKVSASLAPSAGSAFQEGFTLPQEEATVLQQIQGFRETQWCRRLCCGPMYWLPLLLTACAVLIFYGPIVAWGCVPTPDLSRCGARQPPQDINWSDENTWIWSVRYEDDLANLAPVPLQIRRFCYLVSASAIFVAGLLWLAHYRFRPGGGRVLVVPRTSGRKSRDFGIGHGASMTALEAHHMKVPVVFAPGVPAPRGTRRIRRRKARQEPEPSSTPDEDLLSVGIEEPKSPPAPTDEDGLDAAEASSKPESSEKQESEKGAVHEEAEEKPEEAVLRVAARRLRMRQCLAVAGWAWMLGVLRTSDLSLALAGTLHWPEALCCWMGALLAVVATAVVLFKAVQHWHGKLPLWLASALPGALLAVGALLLGLLAYFGILKAGGPQRAPSVGLLQLITDEAARYVDREACRTEDCFRAVALFTSFAQTLLVAGAAVAIVVLAAVFCPLRCKRFSACAHSVTVVVLALLAAVLVIFLQLVHVAGSVRGAGQELPQAEFAFPVIVSMVTQALARCAAPICLLLRLGSLWGIRTLHPRCLHR